MEGQAPPVGFFEMVLSSFHPVIARWFAERIGQPTPAQRRGWESIRSGADTLIAAPTGSGKTFAAFLIALDDPPRGSFGHEVPDEVRVVYVSPLKALSADIHRNLAEPRREIKRLAGGMGVGAARITAPGGAGGQPRRPAAGDRAPGGGNGVRAAPYPRRGALRRHTGRRAGGDAQVSASHPGDDPGI